MNQRPETQLRENAQILDRLARRRTNRIAEFPPDFLHGDAALDEIYGAFGEEWVENVAFVQHHTDHSGCVVAVSVATFSDWFLTVEHLSVDDGAADACGLKRWLASRVSGRHTVIELQSEPTDGAGVPGRRWIDLNCAWTRLIELERSVLHVVRDGASDWRTVAQTNLLSVITLCARLGVNRIN